LLVHRPPGGGARDGVGVVGPRSAEVTHTFEK
jgi:hypothetical protein